MKITIIGTGYVGLVSGTCFAEMGITVSCLDIDEQKIANLRKGILPIWEPGLKELVERNMQKRLLSFSSNYAEALDGATVAFICVGTPPDEDGSADLKYVLAVAREIGKHINDYTVVVTKSTVPIGTAEKVRCAVAEELRLRKANIEFDVASNPEFLKEGEALKDSLHPDRIVIGTDTQRAKDILAKLYQPYTFNGHQIIYMDTPSAEITKYAANAMLATKISFINDIANLCDMLGGDINNVKRGIGSDKRIGFHFLNAGIGFGGSCFPKDLHALIKSGKDIDYQLEILQAVENVNARQKTRLFEKVYDYFGGQLAGKKIVIWGLAFKPNTDDMREAPALVLINKFLEHKAEIFAYDPVAIEEAKRRIGNKITYCNTAYENITDADALLLVTEWSEFNVLNFSELSKMRNKVIFDGRNIYDKDEVRSKGFKYFGIGRK